MRPLPKIHLLNPAPVGKIKSTVAQVEQAGQRRYLVQGVNALTASTPLVFRTLLECLGKSDKRREEREQGGQELHEISQISHGHHLPSHGGRCPAHGTAVNNSYSIK